MITLSQGSAVDQARADVLASLHGHHPPDAAAARPALAGADDRPRPVDEEHRVATPLELLFDLTFVVAVAQVAAELAHGIAEDHVGDGLLGYLMVFFAIWWAWMNFTWFASAYDTDDVPYRLLTLVQMAGVLVLAAGIPDAFGSQRLPRRSPSAT